MSFQSAILFSLALLGSPVASTILWDGRNPTIADLSAWSFSNEVGGYQYYIHGSSNISSYVNLGSSYQNPADTGSSEGIKMTLDSTSFWNGQTMRRTELIPQTKAAIGSGKVYYHFSMSRQDTNAPSENREHQICFFESHFTEMKSGWQSGATGTSDPLLRWNANSATQWNVTWEAGVWHNVAYGIDFDAGTVEFYHSTGSDDLVLTVPAVKVSASSNGADWHLGALELPRDGYTDTDEDFFFSGVYIESGDVTLSVSGPGSSSSSSSGSAVASSTASTASAAQGATSSIARMSSVASSVASMSSIASPVASMSSVASPVASTSSVASPVASMSSVASPVASMSSVASPAACTRSVASTSPMATSTASATSMVASSLAIAKIASTAPTTSLAPTTLATVVATTSTKPTATISSAASSATSLPLATEIGEEAGATTKEKIRTWLSEILQGMVAYLAGEDKESAT